MREISGGKYTSNPVVYAASTELQWHTDLPFPPSLRQPTTTIIRHYLNNESIPNKSQSCNLAMSLETHRSELYNTGRSTRASLTTK